MKLKTTIIAIYLLICEIFAKTVIGNAITTLQNMNRYNMKLNIFFFISIPTFLASCNGQNTSRVTDKISTVTIGDTVSELSNSILIIFQAANRKYWFGSDKDGLYCVDRKTIIHFSTKDSLLDNRTRTIQEDKQENIYVSSLGGINKFDGHTLTTLTAIKNNPSDSA